MAANSNDVGLDDTVRGMPQSLSKLTVVGEQQQPLGICV